MNCIFCKEPSGVLKRYHQGCFESVQQVLKDIEKIVNKYNQEEISASQAQNSLVDMAVSSQLYIHYLNHELDSIKTIKADETIIYFENSLSLFESKNRCKMVRTGYRYEKMPNWNEENFLLDQNALIIFTDKQIYLIAGQNEISYDYNKIVHIGFDEKFGYVYLDVKTTSKIPHRFSLKPIIRKDKMKAHNVCLLLNCLVSK